MIVVHRENHCFSYSRNIKSSIYIDLIFLCMKYKASFLSMYLAKIIPFGH